LTTPSQPGAASRDGRRSIRTLLVANRGEIARRIQRTAHALGMDTVAVFSDADADAPFVRDADQAFRLGPAPAADSYLNVDAILRAAAETGADAIHPGYGFLAENAAFAAAVEAAGLIFVGPTPEAIRSMGQKREAKRIAAEAGVPVIPGDDGADQAPEALAERARALGFPVLLKASAGGGGKGMQVVRRDEELGEAIDSARRVAESAFGDGTLLVERYLERPRHVEIQILGDAYGNVVHLHERECSIQRRHQKILEESPSPGLPEATRQAMGEAAVRLARAIGYRSAGTVELILDQSGAFYFLEVNTRLQVEHPVTELVTGIDLVREQLRIAEGEPLGYGQEAIRPRGAALEARLYAEDPSAGYLPQPGTLVDVHVPDDVVGLRFDGGVETGSTVTVHYDPMLAKLVTHGASREEATRTMRRALRRLSVHGVRTNRALLVAILDHPAYRAGDLHTHFLEEHRLPPDPEPTAPGTTPAAVDGPLVWGALFATLAAVEVEAPPNPDLPALPRGFRNNPVRREVRSWVDGDGGPAAPTDAVASVSFERRRDGRLVGEVHLGEAPDPETATAFEVQRVSAFPDGAGLELTVDDLLRGVRRRARVVRAPELDGRVFVQTRPGGEVTVLREAPRFPDPTAEVAAGALTAPMPGQVVALRAAVGDPVTSGQVLVVLEAMKMEHAVTAPEAGTVEALPVAPGDQVEAGQVLAVVTPS
jgi:acetyl-CoA carboxylase biotin carboxylase subunit